MSKYSDNAKISIKIRLNHRLQNKLLNNMKYLNFTRFKTKTKQTKPAISIPTINVTEDNENYNPDTVIVNSQSLNQTGD